MRSAGSFILFAILKNDYIIKIQGKFYFRIAIYQIKGKALKIVRIICQRAVEALMLFANA
jgi:hypothetical protein